MNSWAPELKMEVGEFVERYRDVIGSGPFPIQGCRPFGKVKGWPDLSSSYYRTSNASRAQSKLDTGASAGRRRL